MESILRKLNRYHVYRCPGYQRCVASSSACTTLKLTKRKTYHCLLWGGIQTSCHPGACTVKIKWQGRKVFSQSQRSFQMKAVLPLAKMLATVSCLAKSINERERWKSLFFNSPRNTTLIARFMGPTWGPPGADRTQVGPMLAPWSLLSGNVSNWFI